jgi:hypothetical protein
MWRSAPSAQTLDLHGGERDRAHLRDAPAQRSLRYSKQRRLRGCVEEPQSAPHFLNFSLLPESREWIPGHLGPPGTASPAG